MAGNNFNIHPALLALAELSQLANNNAGFTNMPVPLPAGWTNQEPVSDDGSGDDAPGIIAHMGTVDLPRDVQRVSFLLGLMEEQQHFLWALSQIVSLSQQPGKPGREFKDEVSDGTLCSERRRVSPEASKSAPLLYAQRAYKHNTYHTHSSGGRAPSSAWWRQCRRRRIITAAAYRAICAFSSSTVCVHVVV